MDCVSFSLVVIFLVLILLLVLYVRVTEITYYLFVAFIISLLIPVVMTVAVMQIDPFTDEDANDADMDPYVSMTQVFTGGLIGDFDPLDPQTENGAFWVEYGYAVVLISMILGFASIFIGGPPDVLKMPAGIAHRLWTGSGQGDPIVPHGKMIESEGGAVPVIPPGPAAGYIFMGIFVIFYASFFMIVGLFVALFGSFFTMCMLMLLSHWWYQRHLRTWSLIWKPRTRSRSGPRKFDPARL